MISLISIRFLLFWLLIELPNDLVDNQMKGNKHNVKII